MLIIFDTLINLLLMYYFFARQGYGRPPVALRGLLPQDHDSPACSEFRSPLLPRLEPRGGS